MYCLHALLSVYTSDFIQEKTMAMKHKWSLVSKYYKSVFVVIYKIK